MIVTIYYIAMFIFNILVVLKTKIQLVSYFTKVRIIDKKSYFYIDDLTEITFILIFSLNFCAVIYRNKNY